MIGKLEDTLSAVEESMVVRLNRIEHCLDSLDRMVSLKTFLLGPKQNRHSLLVTFSLLSAFNIRYQGVSRIILIYLHIYIFLLIQSQGSFVHEKND